MAGVARVDARGPLAVLAAIAVASLLVRFYAASHVGFGDSEALYASYALHPQAAYLDHPGLIGVVARAIGAGGAPSPEAAHRVTSIAATLLPFLLALAARAAGATWRASVLAAIALSAAPEIGVGLFAMTPDLPLAFAWTGALALAALGLRAHPSSARAATSLLFAGLLTGVACASKVSGVLLGIALVVTYAGRPARAHAKTVWPWAGLALGALVAAPIVAYEARYGFPMLQHRLIDTQAEAGLSLRNGAAVILGQIAYVSPVLLVVAWLVARDLTATRRADDPVTRLLFAAFAIPFAGLVTLSFWSRVAEPHWIAPALLALPIQAARSPMALPRRLVTAAVATGLTLIALVYAWVLVPSSSALLPANADPRFDLANELVGWPRAIESVRQILAEQKTSDPADVPVIVGPYWTICAQLHAALGSGVFVGCDSPLPDDFDGWLPRDDWRRASEILFVTDSRYPVDLGARFPHRFAARTWEIPVQRGGRPARTFTITQLVPRALGQISPPPPAPSSGAPRRG